MTQHAENNFVDMKLVEKALDEAAKLLMKHLPLLKQVANEAIDLVFIPKVIGKQFILLLALETGMVTFKQLTAILQSILSNLSSRSRLIRRLEVEQQNACTQDEWMDLAERIDNIQGNDAWRSDPNCPLYERERISSRIDEFVHLMRRNDLFELMFVLRGAIARNKFGLLHEGLFTKAIAGSKVLVETYHNVVCAALDYCCDAPVQQGEDPIPTDARLAFFNETRHAYGRTALLLSGGAALGFYHVGVVRTLVLNGLMPRVIGGSSAGSIVCAMIGTRTDEEVLNDLLEVVGTDAPGHSGRLALNFFRPIGGTDTEGQSPEPTRPHKGGLMEVYYNTAGAFKDAKRTIQTLMPVPIRHFTSFLYDIVTGNRRPQDLFKNDTEHFKDCVRANVGNFTFQEAFDRTGRILNIVVTPNNRSDPPRLLNYLTAPHVMVWSAAVASSSLPGVFEANRLVVKEADGWERYETGDGQRFSDGSMESDLPTQQLSEMFNVNHFIISQANPHAVMFGSYNQKNSIWANPITGFLDSILTYLKNQLRSWVGHLVECLGARRIAPLFDTQRNINTQLFTQEYEGRPMDISLIPWLNHRSFLSAVLHAIYNPSEAEFREWVLAAERETWRYIPAIKSHIAEEMTLDRCVQRLRRRLLQESWEKQSRGTSENIGSRVPSFFTSPSLVNLGGLAVADQPSIRGLHDYGSASPKPSQKEPVVMPPLLSEININSGWGGLGLKGNRSSGNLQRVSSDASGLFIDEEEQQQQQQQQQSPQPTISQNAGEQTLTESSASDLPRSQSTQETRNANASYFKTTSMANFYYRKTGGNRSTGNLPAMRKTTSDPVIDAGVTSTTNGGSLQVLHEKRMSRSHTDLASAAGQLGNGSLHEQ